MTNPKVCRDQCSTTNCSPSRPVFVMVLAKSKNAVGLGNSLMNDRFGKGKGADRKKVSAGIHRTDQNGQAVRNALSIQ